MLYLKKDIMNELVEWTLSEKPNEAAGYLFKENSIFEKIITGDHSVGHFFDDNLERLAGFIEEYGKPTAIFHSHPCAAVPSGMDRRYMETTIPFFGCIWLIMSNDLKLRAWTLREITLITNEVEVKII